MVPDPGAAGVPVPEGVVPGVPGMPGVVGVPGAPRPGAVVGVPNPPPVPPLQAASTSENRIVMVTRKSDFVIVYLLFELFCSLAVYLPVNNKSKDNPL